jgi:hypothetical protein
VATTVVARWEGEIDDKKMRDYIETTMQAKKENKNAQRIPKEILDYKISEPSPTVESVDSFK